MRLIIKNMVCPRCIASVEQLLIKHKFQVKYLRLGDVELAKDPGKARLEQFEKDLNQAGFELLDDQKSQQIEKIKNLLNQVIQKNEIEEHFSISKFLSKHIYKDYSSISKLFSGVEGITIEQFFILQKIEKVKEWLVYNEMSLNEITYKLGYSSTPHLSAQFKKTTGMTPSQFKRLGMAHRIPIDQLHQSKLV